MTVEQGSIDSLVTAITDASYVQSAAMHRIATAVDALTEAVGMLRMEVGASVGHAGSAVEDAVDRLGAPLSRRSREYADRAEASRQRVIRYLQEDAQR